MELAAPRASSPTACGRLAVLAGQHPGEAVLDARPGQRGRGDVGERGHVEAGHGRIELLGERAVEDRRDDRDVLVEVADEQREPQRQLVARRHEADDVGPGVLERVACTAASSGSSQRRTSAPRSSSAAPTSSKRSPRPASRTLRRSAAQARRERTRRSLPPVSSQDLRSLPPVDALAAEVDAPRAVALAAARSVLASRRAELLEGRPGDPDLAGARAGGRRGRLRAALAAARAQRDRRDRAHQPRAARRWPPPRARRSRRPPRATRTSSGTSSAASAARATTTSRRCCAS